MRLPRSGTGGLEPLLEKKRRGGYEGSDLGTGLHGVTGQLAVYPASTTPQASGVNAQQVIERRRIGYSPGFFGAGRGT